MIVTAPPGCDVTRQELGPASPTSRLSTRQGTATRPDSTGKGDTHPTAAAVDEQSTSDPRAIGAAVVGGSTSAETPHVTVITALARRWPGLNSAPPLAAARVRRGPRIPSAGAFLTTPLDRQVRIRGASSRQVDPANSAHPAHLSFAHLPTIPPTSVAGVAGPPPKLHVRHRCRVSVTDVMVGWTHASADHPRCPTGCADSARPGEARRRVTRPDTAPFNTFSLNALLPDVNALFPNTVRPTTVRPITTQPDPARSGHGRPSAPPPLRMTASESTSGSVALHISAPADFAARLPELISVYMAAMGYPDGIAGARSALWQEHSHRPGFRCVVAVDQKDEVRGLTYGYTGQPGQWWYSEVQRGIGDSASPWLGNYLELTELHVRPDSQGAGLGQALLMALLDGRREAVVLLSTPEGTNRAWRLYRRMGFVDVLRHYRFTGDPRPFGVLGRTLPMEVPGRLPGDTGR